MGARALARCVPLTSSTRFRERQVDALRAKLLDAERARREAAGSSQELEARLRSRTERISAMERDMRAQEERVAELDAALQAAPTAASLATWKTRATQAEQQATSLQQDLHTARTLVERHQASQQDAETRPAGDRG